MLAEYEHEVSSFWKLRLPLKIKVFLWYHKRGVTLTKDNLIKQNRKGDGSCFCSSAETIQHTLLQKKYLPRPFKIASEAGSNYNRLG